MRVSRCGLTLLAPGVRLASTSPEGRLDLLSYSGLYGGVLLGTGSWGKLGTLLEPAFPPLGRGVATRGAPA